MCHAHRCPPPAPHVSSLQPCPQDINPSAYPADFRRGDEDMGWAPQDHQRAANWDYRHRRREEGFRDRWHSVSGSGLSLEGHCAQAEHGRWAAGELGLGQEQGTWVVRTMSRGEFLGQA